MTSSMYLESSYIKDLILEGESTHLDFKYHVADAGKIAKTLVAFANTQGGRLLLGVKDNGRIIGVQSTEEAYMIETASSLFCKPEVPYEIVEWEVDNRTVLEVHVPRSNQRPHFAKNEEGKWGVYLRVNDHNKFANRVVVQTLKREKSRKRTYIRYSDLEKQLLDYLESSESVTLAKLTRMLKISKRRAENMLINLASIGVISVHHDGKGFYYALSNEVADPLF